MNGEHCTRCSSPHPAPNLSCFDAAKERVRILAAAAKAEIRPTIEYPPKDQEADE